MKKILLALPLSILAFFAAAQNLISYSESPTDLLRPNIILRQMKKVADWQIQETDIKGWRHERWDWTNGALYPGIFAVGSISKEDKYHNWLRKMGQDLNWQTGPRRFFADDYIVGATFAKLYALDKKPEYIDNFRKLADSIIAASHEESLEWKNEVRMREWAWCDALFMGPTALTQLGVVTAERKYHDISDKLWWKTTDYLFDKEENLFYRDSRYFTQKEKNGQKLFWSRGNGWVMGGLCFTLENLPADHVSRPRYIELFKKMANRLAALQQPDGTWHTSLLDPEAFPNREVSGTAFFTYAFLRGISEGWLPAERYFPICERAWRAMNECIAADGKLGFVQQIGAAPRPVTVDDTEVYGVGAFLLAGAELHKLAIEKPQLMAGVNKRNIMANALKTNNLSEILRGVNNWRADKKKQVLADFQNLPTPVKEELLKDADKYLGYSYPSLLATDYLLFDQKGDRATTDKATSKRLEIIKTLLVAELIDRKGKYLNDLLNGLWLTAEQSAWIGVAHLAPLQKKAKSLPHPEEEVIDIYAGEVANLLGWSVFLLEDELSALSQNVPVRLRYELNRRIFDPYLSRNDFWWLGYSDRYPVNNWNTWTNTNVFETALLIEPDPKRLARITEKALLSLDQFLNPYNDDGGCDEGPSYWKRAAGELFQFLTILKTVSGGKFDVFDQKPLKEMGRFILKTHIADNRFVNFADAGHTNMPYLPPVFYAGKAYNDPDLLQFAAYLNQLPDTNNIVYIEGGKKMTFRKELIIAKFIRYVGFFDELKNTEPRAPRIEKSWLPNVGVVALRSKNDVFFAAQGGHNGESHNHNDVGNFVFYKNGKPIIIDAGRATYKKETFGASRYTLWHTQSDWHNCPTINGLAQNSGDKARAENMTFSEKKDVSMTQLDISKAYPAEAKVKKWQRSFTFNPEKGSVILEEDYAFDALNKPFEVNFLLKNKPTLAKNTLDIGGATLRFDPSVFDVKIEEKLLNDKLLESDWAQKSLWRVIFIAKNKALIGKHRFEIE